MPHTLSRGLTLFKASCALLLTTLALPAFSECWDPLHASSRYTFRGWVVDNDPASKLMWDGCPFGRSGFLCADGATSTPDWSSATLAAQSHTFGGYNDWRLATLDELLTLVAPACSPTINGFLFQATPLAAFWTQTSDPSNAGNAQTVNFFNGFVTPINRNNPVAVRFVRGGLPIDTSLTTAQSVVFGAAPALGVGGTATLNFSNSSSPNSGNPIRVASTTPTVCSVDAAGVVTGLAAGTCTVTANRYGRVNAGVNYAPAAQASQSFDVACWNGGSTPKANPLYVVQSGVQNSNGTVVDTETNLMWKQCTEGLSGNGCGSGNANFVKWDDGNIAASGSRFASYSDWRMPTLSELQSLLPSGCGAPGPTVNQSVFPNTNAYFYWSSSLAAVASSSASLVDFTSGTTTYGNRASGLNVRLVRAGQAFDTLTPTPQTLTFNAPPALELGDDPIVIARSSVPNSGNRVTYGTATPALCVVNVSNGGIAFTASALIGDTCTVTADQFGSFAGGKNYAPATQVTQNIINKKLVQSLEFGAAPAVIVGGSGGLAATSNVGLTPITFSSASSGICTVSGINGSTVTGIALGTCIVQASQAGSPSVASATAQTSLAVGIGCNLRMNGGSALAATREGLILLRAMLGMSGTQVTQGTGVSTPWTTLRDQLNANCGTSFQ